MIFFFFFNFWDTTIIEYHKHLSVVFVCVHYLYLELIVHQFKQHWPMQTCRGSHRECVGSLAWLSPNFSAVLYLLSCVLQICLTKSTCFYFSWNAVHQNIFYAIYERCLHYFILTPPHPNSCAFIYAILSVLLAVYFIYLVSLILLSPLLCCRGPYTSFTQAYMQSFICLHAIMPGWHWLATLCLFYSTVT